MPEVVFMYNPEVIVLPFKLSELGEKLKPLFAAAASTDGVRLTESDVDWIPTALEPGSSVSWNVSIKLVTIGYPDRKKKLDEAGVRELKRRCLEVPELSGLVHDPSAPLIWVHFTDPGGVHV